MPEDIPAEIEFTWRPQQLKRRARFTMPDLTSDYPPSIAARIDLFAQHPLVTESDEDRHAALGEELAAKRDEARAKLVKQLSNEHTRLLGLALHKMAMNTLAEMGCKIRRLLRYELPKTHKADAKNEVSRRGQSRRPARLRMGVSRAVAFALRLLIVVGASPVHTAAGVRAIHRPDRAGGRP